MIIQSNSKVFTTTVFGLSTNQTSSDITGKNRTTQEQVLESSSFSNLRTQMPRVPSNQKIAKDQ